MIDFKNATFIKLRPVDDKHFRDLIDPIFVAGEEIIQTFLSVRDGIVFTTKRIIAINVQGVTGKKKDITSIPYSKIQAYSVETAGVIDWDSELEIWVSAVGKMKFEFTAQANVSRICRVISDHVL